MLTFYHDMKVALTEPNSLQVKDAFLTFFINKHSQVVVSYFNPFQPFIIPANSSDPLLNTFYVSLRNNINTRFEYKLRAPYLFIDFINSQLSDYGKLIFDLTKENKINCSFCLVMKDDENKVIRVHAKLRYVDGTQIVEMKKIGDFKKLLHSTLELHKQYKINMVMDLGELLQDWKKITQNEESINFKLFEKEYPGEIEKLIENLSTQQDLMSKEENQEDTIQNDFIERDFDKWETHLHGGSLTIELDSLEMAESNQYDNEEKESEQSLTPKKRKFEVNPTIPVAQKNNEILDEINELKEAKKCLLRTKFGYELHAKQSYGFNININNPWRSKFFVPENFIGVVNNSMNNGGRHQLYLINVNKPISIPEISKCNKIIKDSVIEKDTIIIKNGSEFINELVTLHCVNLNILTSSLYANPKLYEMYPFLIEFELNGKRVQGILVNKEFDQTKPIQMMVHTFKDKYELENTLSQCRGYENQNNFKNEITLSSHGYLSTLSKFCNAYVNDKKNRQEILDEIYEKVIKFDLQSTLSRESFFEKITPVLNLKIKI